MNRKEVPAALAEAQERLSEAKVKRDVGWRMSK
jgi:hypothetical protein